MKKSEQTKAKLVNAVINLINKGQKISVASISKEAKTAYGSFYRYFNNLDEIHEAAIINVVLEVAANLDNCLLYTSPSPRDRTRSRMPSSA